MRLTISSSRLAHLALASACLATPFNGSAQPSCNDRDCATTLMRGHIATQPGYWKSRMQRPLAQRIGAAPPELLEYVRLDNLSAGLASVPREATLTPDFLRDVRRALDEIPAPVKRLVGSRLAGIYLVEELGSTGYTDTIFTADGKGVAGFIVLDAAVLKQRSANAWATWKENTPFKPEPGFSLTATIAPAGQDNRRNAIQYILLHELGHIASIGADIHPHWGIAPSDVGRTENLAYFKLSWTIARQENRFISLFEPAFETRRDVVYYAQAKLRGSQMQTVYTELAATNFATLYAATSPGDDFAEAFVSYIHTVMMRKPLHIEIRHADRTLLAYSSCWTQARCADKRALLEQVLRAK